MNGKIFTLLAMTLIATLLSACAKEPPSRPEDRTIRQLEEMAEQGNADAQNRLGGLYYKGEGVTQDFAQAAYWAQKAAEQGRADAQANLAIMYYKGEGVAQDFTQAYVWWRLAAAQADISLGSDIEHVAEKLSPRQLSEAEELVAKIQAQTGHLSESK